jgi:hypothetical protein
MDEVEKEIVTMRHALRSGPYEVELINQYHLEDGSRTEMIDKVPPKKLCQ